MPDDIDTKKAVLIDGDRGYVIATREATGRIRGVIVDHNNNRYACRYRSGLVIMLSSYLSEERVLITTPTYADDSHFVGFDMWRLKCY